MRFMILMSTMVAAAITAPQDQSTPVAILRQESLDNGDGSYQYSFETGNGISADQNGVLKKVGDVEALEVKGQFQYPSDDGSPAIQLSYTADENGFHPQGAHLPTPPPIPADIQRALDYIATAKPLTETAPQ